MFYSQGENIWFWFFYPRLKVVSEKYWLCHWSEWNFIHYTSDSSFKYVSNVPCHGPIHFSPASKLSPWMDLQAFPKSCFLWLCFDQKMSEFSTMFQTRQEKNTFFLFCFVMTSYCFILKSWHHYRIIPVQSQWFMRTRIRISPIFLAHFTSHLFSTSQNS